MRAFGVGTDNPIWLEKEATITEGYARFDMYTIDPTTLDSDGCLEVCPCCHVFEVDLTPDEVEALVKEKRRVLITLSAKGSAAFGNVAYLAQATKIDKVITFLYTSKGTVLYSVGITEADFIKTIFGELN
jgi:hypothetical protein